MPLRLLQTTPELRIFYDEANEWLYLDWQGVLTLPAVQAGWLTLTRCLLARPYPCVLNSNAQVSGVDWEIAAWMRQGFEQFLQVSGTRQVAWVHAPGLRGLDFAQSVVSALPQLQLALFADEEQAVSWLRQHCPPPAAEPAHSAADYARLLRLVDALEQLVEEPQLVLASRSAHSRGHRWLLD